MKTISQMYAEHMRSFAADPARDMSTMYPAQLARQLHEKFWGPIQHLLNPRGQYGRPGSRAKDFYEPGVSMSLDELAEISRRLAEWLPVERVSPNTAFKVLPLLRSTLKNALVHDDMDIVMVADAEFLKRELGGVPSQDYGCFKPPLPHIEVFSDRDGMLDADFEVSPLTEADQSERIYSTSESNFFGHLINWETMIGDPVRFERQFPGMGYRRANVEAVLKPVLELDWSLDGNVIACVLGHVRVLLKNHFHESLGRLTSGPSIAVA